MACKFVNQILLHNIWKYIDFIIEKQLFYKSIILIMYYMDLNIVYDIISLVMNQNSWN